MPERAAEPRARRARVFLVRPLCVVAAVCALSPAAFAGEPSGTSAAPAGPPKEDRSAELPRFPASIDELSAPHLPPPFVLPELSHPDWDLAVGWLVGVGTSERADRPTSALGLLRLSAEGAVVFPRRFYIGVEAPFAGGPSQDGTGGTKTLLGNVDLHARVVFPLPSWLAFGAVMGLTLPTAQFKRDTAASEAALAVAALEPTDLVQFKAQTIGFRPAMDMRLLRGPFVFQARQGIDVALDSSGKAATVGRFLGHIGVRIRNDFELSIEATQLYQFDERVSDDKRTAMTIGPGARLLLRNVDIGVAAVTNLYAPLSPALDQFVAARVSLIVHRE